MHKRIPLAYYHFCDWLPVWGWHLCSDCVPVSAGWQFLWQSSPAILLERPQWGYLKKVIAMDKIVDDFLMRPLITEMWLTYPCATRPLITEMWLTYPCATRCGGDIVTLLWVRVCPCVGPSVRGPCEHDRDYTVACFFVKLGRHVDHDERMNPVDFGGQRSKVKVTMGIYGTKLVNTLETKPLCISLSNLADMLAMVRGWTLLILHVRGQRSRSQWTYMEISLWTG